MEATRLNVGIDMPDSFNREGSVRFFESWTGDPARCSAPECDDPQRTIAVGMAWAELDCNSPNCVTPGVPHEYHASCLVQKLLTRIILRRALESESIAEDRYFALKQATLTDEEMIFATAVLSFQADQLDEIIRSTPVAPLTEEQLDARIARVEAFLQSQS